MALQNINLGTAAGDGTGDNLRAAGAKLNSNFKEIFLAALGPANILGSALGDSIIGQQTGPTAYNNLGSITWARRLSRQRINIPTSYFKGVGGENMAQVAARVPDILALNPRPSFCFVYAGTNGMGTGGSRSLMSGIIKTLSEAGILPIIQCIQPATSGSAHSAQMDFNVWLKTIASGAPQALTNAGLTSKHLFLVVDPSKYITDFTSATGAPIAGMKADGLHPGPREAYYTGRELVRVIEQAFGPYRIPRTTDILDVYIAGTAGADGVAVSGNLLPGTLGIMYGTGGIAYSDIYPNGSSVLTNNGLATGLEYQKNSGNSASTVVLSKVAKEDPEQNGTRQQISINITAPAASNPQGFDDYTFGATIPTGNLAVGDIVVVELDVEVIGTPVNLRNINLIGPNGALDSADSGGLLAQVPMKLTCRTPPVAITSAGSVRVSLDIFMKGDVAGGSAVIAFDNWVSRKVASLLD